MGLSTGNGVSQWAFQRFANVLLIVFAAVLAVIVLCNPSYDGLVELLSKGWFKIYLLVTLIVGCLNSVLAGWQIAGDYAAKAHMPQWLLVGLVAVVTLVYLIVGLQLLV